MTYADHPLARMVAQYPVFGGVEENERRLRELLPLASALLDDPEGPCRRYSAYEMDVDVRRGRLTVGTDKVHPGRQEWLLRLVGYTQYNTMSVLEFELPRVTAELVGYLLDPGHPDGVSEIVQRYLVPYMEAAE